MIQAGKILNVGLATIVLIIVLAILINTDILSPVCEIFSNGELHAEAFEGSNGDPYDSKMPGVRCPRSAERGVVTWVLSGKHCPKCNHPC